MRPLSLKMAAFGPFASVENIDFSALGDNPLFLLNGPTGAGKTTILDAICFALYGKTTGDEREGSQMRCDMADEGLLTEVEFTFVLGTSQYRIRRVPEQQRLKKNGDGYTVHKPEAQLYAIDSEGQESLLVPSKVSEATAEIEQLTGLDADQFRQVMVLPQGKFRQLLMADSKDREKIFSQLFQTQIYRKIEDRLKAKASTIRSQVAEHRNRRDGILLNAKVESDDNLAEELMRLTPLLEDATAKKNAQADALLNANKALQQAQGIAADFDMLANLDQTEKALKEQGAEVGLQQQKLALSEKAEKVTPYYQSVVSANQSILQQQQQLTQSTAEFEQSKARLSKNELDAETLPALEQTKQQHLNRVQELQPLLPVLQSLSQLRQQVEHKQSQLSEAEASGKERKSALDVMLETIKSGNEQQALLQQSADKQAEIQQRVSVLISDVDTHQQWLKAVDAKRKSEQDLSISAEKGNELKGLFTQAESQHKQLQWVWHKGQAAILAKELEQDQPCPVCGSDAHPHPATSAEAIPTEAELEQAAQAMNDAQQQLQDARQSYTAIKTQLQQHISRCDELKSKLAHKSDAELAQLASALEQEKSALAQATAAQQQLVNLREMLKQNQAQEQQLREQLENARGHYQSLNAEVVELNTKLSESSNAIPKEFENEQMLQQAMAKAKSQADGISSQIETIRTALGQAQQAVAAAQAAEQAAQQALTRANAQQADATTGLHEAYQTHGFADDKAYLSAIMEPEQQRQWKHRVDQFAEDVQRNKANMTQLNVKLAGIAQPNMAELEQALHQCQSARESSEAAWQQLHTRVSVLQSTQTQLAESDKQTQTLDQAYAVIGTLSDVANGVTGNKISLQRFVLSVLLDDVLLEASHRLRVMSKGRYQLLRKEDRAKGNKASGLELEVEDAYTSKVRSVATLSGGESFMAALSMALGLSDVVQAYAGGIKLDTLFIDEGFGSLDQESLDLAVRTLVDLQSSGRMIGVISHVSEMKEQIGIRIDINKTSAGSKTSVVMP